MRQFLPFLIAVMCSISRAQNSATSQPTSEPTTQPTTQPARMIVDYPLPPASEYPKQIGAIAKRYGISLPGKSFADLRKIRVAPEGQTHRTQANADQISSPAADIARYSLYLPNSYGSGEKPFGLIVWIAPMAGVEMLRPWRDVLDKHHILFIAPHDVPNESHSIFRIFMAIDSVRQMKSHYNIDPDRIYIAGMSGGGRISSHAAVFFPDIFNGGFCIVGSNFYRDVSAGPGKIYPGFWSSPIASEIARGRANTRLVLMTGSRDFNQPSTQAAYDAYLQDKWAHVTYIEVPEMGHQMPRADWFEKGIVALDEPLASIARDRYDQAVAFEKQHKLGDACLAFESSARHVADPSTVADAMKRAAEIRKKFDERTIAITQMIQQKKLEQAASATRQLKSDFGPLATDVAQKLIDQIRDARKPKTEAGK